MRLLQRIAATLLMAAIVIGAPWLLLQLGQLPGFLPPWDQLSTLLLSPDNGRLLLVIIWVAAWALWLWLTAIILTETISAVRGVRAPTLPGGSLAQPAIRLLVMAAIGTFVAGTAATPSTAAPPVIVTNPEVPAATAPATTNPAQSPPESVAPTVTVEEGDTLWSLAEEHLDDPLKWPELYELNRGIEQPTGYALEDPDAIDVGWILKLPASPATQSHEQAAVPAEAFTPTSPDAVPPTPTPTPEVSTPETALPPAPPAVVPSATPTSVPAQIPAAGVSTDDDTEEAPIFAWHVAGLLGAGSFLGAGVAAALARRRREQFRTRRPGRTIAEPSRHTAPIEMTAHVASGLSTRLVHRLDAVLRRLHGTVDITTVAVATDGTITLTTNDQLPPPWEHGTEEWTLPTATPADQIAPGDSDAPCAYPLLVTIGTDTSDRVILINLENLGHITVGGDPVMRADFARYLAAELAVNPWSEGIRVACHGPAADAIAMAPDRLDATDTEILELGQHNQNRADRSGATARQGRATLAEDEIWGAGVALNPHPDTDLAEVIAAQPRTTGIALVTETTDEATLTLTASGRVTGLGLELTAVGLTEDEATGCAILLKTTTHDDEPPPAADELTDVTGNLLDQHRAHRTDDTAHPGLLPEGDEEYLAETATTSEDLAVLAPRVKNSEINDLADRDPSLDEDVRMWFSDKCPYPRLSLLGPVKARCYGKPIAKQKAYYTEALAYLALHPSGVTGDQLADAFGLTVPRARTAVSNLRQWLGTNPRTSEPHIPDAKASPEAHMRGVGVYVVQDLLIDADLFRRLRTRAVAKGADGIADLETALELVQGRPFDQLRPAGWAWLFEGDRVDHHMICAIGDVAHILVTHHLHTGDYEAARRAATIALQTDPDSEIAKLDLAAIMVETGHSELARQALADALGEVADMDLTGRGFEIANRLGWLRN